MEDLDKTLDRIKAYEEAGVSIVSTAKALWYQADVIIKVQKPEKT